MNYRLDKYGNRLSILGFGCLRFPQKKGKIDMEETEAEIKLAIEQGVNYFDTAYIYSGSEAALGEILEKNHLRDKVNIATKLPYYLIKSRAGLDRLFDEELKRLRTDHIDYYLMHMLNDVAAWERLKAMGIEEWIAEKQTRGQIRQVGFSYHGNSAMFRRVVDAYDWDFCQIQYNYLDEHSQAGVTGLRHAHARGIPVVIMEPLRGGRLVSALPEKAKKVFSDYPVKRTPAEWGLRWLWNQKEVTVVLSGMNSREMLLENIRVASDVQVGELGEQEFGLYARAVKAINENVKVGCTGCGYCMPCPKGVDIPGTFATYNRWFSGENRKSVFKEYLRLTAMRSNSTSSSNCVGCGKCERHCPQGIPIRDKLKEARTELEGPKYQLLSRVVKWFAGF